MDKFEFDSGPDRMTAQLYRYEGGPKVGEPYISFHGKGPRGGYVYGPGIIGAAAMEKLDDMIAEAKGWPHRCKGCGRAEDDCSAEPCAEVIADREDSWTDEPTHVPGLMDALAPKDES
jgi:hypothetical protein